MGAHADLVHIYMYSSTQAPKLLSVLLTDWLTDSVTDRSGHVSPYIYHLVSSRARPRILGRARVRPGLSGARPGPSEARPGLPRYHSKN